MTLGGTVWVFDDGNHRHGGGMLVDIGHHLSRKFWVPFFRKSATLFASVAFASAALSTCLQNSAIAASGIQSNGGGVIGQPHITFATQFGDSVSYVILGNNAATGTGTFVPSSVPEQLKFLTAAHNIDNDDNGVPDFPSVTLFFGAAPGVNGAAATYSVQVPSNQIVISPAWSMPGNAGAATNDLTVITFNVADVVAVTGGTLPQVSPIATQNPLGQQSVILGHGLHGDGTVPLIGAVPLANDVDGVLKGGTNIVDFVGVPGAISPPTISAASGVVVLADFDNGDPNVSSFAGVNTNPGLEAGTAAGDSGSPILIDSNGDGIFEIAGVLNGGDNPFGQAGEFGDVSQYAPVFTDANQAFLRQQGVFLGVDVNGTPVNGNFAIIDVATIATQQGNLNQAVRLATGQVEALQRVGSAHLDVIANRRFRAVHGLSLLDNSIQSFALSLSSEAAPSTNPQFEIFTTGGFTLLNGGDDLDFRQISGQIGLETLLAETILAGLVVGRSGTSEDFESKTTSLSGYAIGHVNQHLASVALGWANHDIDSRLGPTRFQAEADLFSAELGMSTDMPLGDIILSPHGSVRYTFGDIRDMSTTTAGVTANLADQDFSQLRGEIGLRASAERSIEWGTLTPFVGGAFGYRHNFSDNALEASAGINPFFGLQAAGGGVGLVNLATPLNLTATTAADNNAVFGRLEAGIELLTFDGIGFSASVSANFESDGSVEGGAFIGASMRF